MITTLITITLTVGVLGGVGFVCFWWGVNHEHERTLAEYDNSGFWARRALSAEKTADMLVNANIELGHELRAAQHGMTPVTQQEAAEFDRITRRGVC